MTENLANASVHVDKSAAVIANDSTLNSYDFLLEVGSVILEKGNDCVEAWESIVDLRIKLLIVLVLWLLFNLLLVRFVWRIHGNKLHLIFDKKGKSSINGHLESLGASQNHKSD